MCACISSTKAICLVHHNYLTFSYLAKPGDQYEPCSPYYTMYCSLVFLRHSILRTNKHGQFPSGSPTENLYSYLSSPIHTTRSNSPPPGLILTLYYLQGGDIMKPWREAILQHHFTSLQAKKTPQHHLHTLLLFIYDNILSYASWWWVSLLVINVKYFWGVPSPLCV